MFDRDAAIAEIRRRHPNAEVSQPAFLATKSDIYLAARLDGLRRLDFDGREKLVERILARHPEENEKELMEKSAEYLNVRVKAIREQERAEGKEVEEDLLGTEDQVDGAELDGLRRDADAAYERSKAAVNTGRTNADSTPSRGDARVERTVRRDVDLRTRTDAEIEDAAWRAANEGMNGWRKDGQTAPAAAPAYDLWVK